MNPKPTNEILLDLRESKDIKQYVIADLLDMSQQQYSRYEKGTSELPIRFVPMLADYYGVSAEYIIGMKDGMYGVPGLDRSVTKDLTAGEVLSDILSLSKEGRAFVIECIALRKSRENCVCQKEQPAAKE